MTGRDDARKRPGAGGRSGESRKDSGDNRKNNGGETREKNGQQPELEQPAESVQIQPANAASPVPTTPVPTAKPSRKSASLPGPVALSPATLPPTAPLPEGPPRSDTSDLPEADLPEAGNDDEPDGLTPELVPMFPGAGPFLARFLPYSPPTHAGLNQNFCDLHAFLKYLHEAAWYGYLQASLGDQTAYVLLFEGRTVTAAAASATGEQALGELLNLYEQGASMSAHPLPAVLAHVLSGVGNRAWKFNLTEDFTGLHARPTGAIFYARGEIVATLPATLPYEGAFPAPLRPQTLILPRSLAGWAHHQYTLTLRGKDAMNAITGVYQQFRTQHGLAGIAFLRALGENLTPAEYATRSDVALHDLEPLVQEFIKTGCVREG
jgi:hypothetical protein